MAAVDRSDALIAIEAAGGDIVSILQAGENLDAAVPTCPDWTLAKLGLHLGRVYGMVTAAIHLGPGGEGRPPKEAWASIPEEVDVANWLSDRLAGLLRALEEAPDDHLCWNFIEGPRSPVAFWWRRQVHETLIHRFDAQLAVSAADSPAALLIAEPIPSLAADGIMEFLKLNYRPVGWEELQLGDAMTVHLHVTDAGEGAEWTVDCDNGSYALAHLKADVALRGPAWALDRWLWRRGSIGDGPGSDLSSELEAFGDWKAAESWRPSL